jgi:GNAT superfamily N-acetyltransferase
MSATVRVLGHEDVELVRHIDRSEHVHEEYEVAEGRLRERPVTMAEIPGWASTGDGPHSFQAQIRFCRESLQRGGYLLGAYLEEQLAGLAVVEPSFEPPLARLAFLHVSRPHRGAGVGKALWTTALQMARAASARRLYVSATPTGSAVNFYLRQGCVLAAPPHPALFKLEPEDIHLLLPFQ